MNQVKAVSGATADEMLRLKDLALEMGSTTKFSAKEAADAMGFLAMAGLSVERGRHGTSWHVGTGGGWKP